MFEPRYLKADQVDAIFEQALLQAEAKALIHYLNYHLDEVADDREEHRQAATRMHRAIEETRGKWERIKAGREVSEHERPES